MREKGGETREQQGGQRYGNEANGVKELVWVRATVRSLG